MGSYFIYDSINQYRSDNTVSEGTSNGTVFSPGSAITDHELLLLRQVQLQIMKEYQIKIFRVLLVQ